MEDRLRGVSVIHTADLHLGIKNINSDSRSKDCFETLAYIVHLCNAKSVDFLLIAGDLFDSYSPDVSTVNYVAEVLGGLLVTKVIISPGNHDYICTQSPYKRNLWNNNIYIFQGNMDFFEFNIRNQRVRIYGGAFTDKYSQSSIMQQRKVMRDLAINIGVFHGELVMEKGKSNFSPITKEQIQNNRFDYTALGHIHKRSEVLTTDYGCFSYSGCPEGQGFDECGINGVYYGDIYIGGADIEFIRTCSKQYSIFEFTLDDKIYDEEKLAEEIHKEYAGNSLEDILCRLVIKGNNVNNLKMHKLRNLLRDFYYLEIKDETSYDLPTNEIGGELLIRFQEKINEKILIEEQKESPDKRVIDGYLRALEYGKCAIERINY